MVSNIAQSFKSAFKQFSSVFRAAVHNKKIWAIVIAASIFIPRVVEAETLDRIEIAAKFIDGVFMLWERPINDFSITGGNGIQSTVQSVTGQIPKNVGIDSGSENSGSLGKTNFTSVTIGNIPGKTCQEDCTRNRVKVIEDNFEHMTWFWNCVLH